MNRNWVYSLFALWIVCSFACMQPKPVANVEVQKENFVFSIKGTDTLSLDKYELTSMSPASKKPVMIFAFGGGFKGGDKADIFPISSSSPETDLWSFLRIIVPP